MIPDLTALVSPVAQLIPAAAAPGVHPLTSLLGTPVSATHCPGSPHWQSLQ